MTISYSKFKGSYQKLWDKLVVTKPTQAQMIAKRILANKIRYQTVEKRTGVPWYFTGLVHYRESNLDFNTYLGNGQSLKFKTTIVPKGRGPFTTFEDGAVDAYKVQGYKLGMDWSLDHMAFLLEGYNGYGYQSKGIPSPYLVGGSNLQKPGKYVADHVYDPNVMDTQLGVLTILKELTKLDPSIMKQSLTVPSIAVAASAGAAAVFTWPHIWPFVLAAVVTGIVGWLIYEYRKNNNV